MVEPQGRSGSSAASHSAKRINKERPAFCGRQRWEIQALARLSSAKVCSQCRSDPSGQPTDDQLTNYAANILLNQGLAMIENSW